MLTINENLFGLAFAAVCLLISCLLTRRQMKHWQKLAKPHPPLNLRKEEEGAAPDEPEIAAQAMPHLYEVPDRTGYIQ